jgi:maltose-binding protein MalE
VSAAGPSQPATAAPAPAQPAAATPSATAPAVEEPPEIRTAEPWTVESQPAAREELAPLKGLAFRVDPSIGNDPFFRWAAERFAQRMPGFELVAGPGSANLDASAWPRGADILGGLDNRTAFTYERLPQLVAAKLVRPLDGWFDTAQLAPVLVDAVRVGGKVYGVPIGGRTPILYYNRDLVRYAPRQWADITALAAEYAQKGGDALVMPSLEPFFMGMFPESRGIQLLIPDTVKTELGSAKAAAVYNDMRIALVETAMSIGLPQDEAVAMFLARRAALLIDGPWSFETLARALGGSLGVATLPTWGAPARELTPYVNVLALFVSTGVNDDRAAALRRFSTFLLEQESQVELAVIRLKTGDPIAPALRALDAPTARLVQQEQIISTLHRQLETAVPMPRGPLAADAWKVFQEVLEGIRRQEGGEMLTQMADARFLLYGLERRTVPAGARELRAVIDPPEKSQGLFFRPFDEESDLRLISIGDSRGVVSANNRGLRSDRGELSFVYLVVNHDPYRDGRAPVLKGRIEYFDEPNATLRVVYDSKDRTVREYPDEPDTWGAWKEAIVIPCTGTRTWKAAEFPVPDARFDRRCNGADLRIEVSAKGKIPAIRSVILTPAK